MTNTRNKQKLKLIKGPKFTKLQSWNMSYHLARIIAKGVYQFRQENTHTSPINKTPEEWYKDLKEIEWVFNEIADDYPHHPVHKIQSGDTITKEHEKEFEEYNQRIHKGLHLFADSFEDMWD